MPTLEPAVAKSIAAAEKRFDEMEVISDILSGQVRRQRRELEAIREALAAHGPGPEQSGQVAPGDISPDMLA